MVILLLTVIYLAFIALGLPDALLGTAWPLMHVELGANNELAGVISFTVSAFTVVASLFSARLIRRFGTGRVVLVSVLSTVIGVSGYMLCRQAWMLFASAVFLGLGAGAVDTALSNYVALHFHARHMSWLHCFWGVGAMASGYIMAAFLGSGQWRMGFQTVALTLLVIVLSLLFTMKLWKIYEKEPLREEKREKAISNTAALKRKGVKALMLAMFCNNGYELTISVWMATYLVGVRGIAIDAAAAYSTLTYLGITGGRLLSGALTTRISDRDLIRWGVIISLVGVGLVLLPLPEICSAVGLITIGLGAAPVFPSILHLTPEKYGEQISATVIGLEMSAAYVGAALMPVLAGLILRFLGARWIPFVVLGLFILMLLSTETARRQRKTEE